MIRIVLDANVFVSAVLSPAGNPGRILDMAGQGRLKLLLSPAILSEINAVLFYPKLKRLHRKTPKWIDAFMREFTDMAEVTPGDLPVDVIKTDPSDNIYLACALEGRADFIISGDSHLRDLENFHEIPIVSPAELLESCRAA